jgi:hypothetical protein
MQTLNIPLSMAKVLVTLWIVYPYTVTTKIQTSFLTQLPERKKSLRDFTMRPTVTIKHLKRLMVVIEDGSTTL